MQSGTHALFKLSAILILASVLSCTALSAAESKLRLRVEPVAAGAPLKLDQLALRNRAGEDWSVTRLSFFVGGLSLQTMAGAWLSVPESTAWLDAGKGRLDWVVDGIQAGDYQALRFHIGLAPELNDADPAQWPPEHPLNPNLNGLHWSWQGGYIFLALEGRFTSGAGTPRGYAFHLAREPFRTTVSLPVKFELREDRETAVKLQLDAAALLDGTKPISFVSDGASTHSKDGDPVAEALHANLAAAFRVAIIPEKQTSKTSSPPSLPAHQPGQYTPYPLQLNSAFPLPALPKDNPLQVERVDLGRKLFHEPALSRDGTLSCASCHFAENALSDPRRFSPGVEGWLGNRNAMPLFNLAWKREFFWDGRATGLRQQVLQPIQDHREMDESLDRVTAKLTADATYPPAFERAFGSAEINAEKLALALENFLLTLVSHDSKFDRAMRGEEKLSELEQRGFDLFMMEREPRLGTMGGDCFHCHGGALFTDHQFRNNGLPIDEADLGRFLASQSPIDRGAFSTPSLRNIALTAPYMHDGRFATLEEVLDHYSEGVQRTDTLDPNLAKHPDGGLHLDANEKAALIAFLRTLTDDRFARGANENP